MSKKGHNPKSGHSVFLLSTTILKVERFQYTDYLENYASGDISSW
jgi:hypothetical protein